MARPQPKLGRAPRASADIGIQRRRRSRGIQGRQVEQEQIMNAHNMQDVGGASPAPAIDPSSVAADQLKSVIERIERLEEEKAGIAGDIKDVYAEAKANGFDVKVLRKIISMRKRDHDERQEEEAILELYLQALGMV
jgi:uncharacterized protein (UPF0335 family)